MTGSYISPEGYSLGQMDDFFAALANGSIRSSTIMNYVQHLAIARRCMAGTRVLDLCCGRGLLIPFLATQAPDIIDYVGVDIAPDHLEDARSRLVDLEELSGRVGFSVKLVEGDVSDRLLPDQLGLFDTISYTSSIEHLPRDRGQMSLANVADLLAPGGSAIISTPITGLGEPLQYQVHVYEYSFTGLLHALDQAGLHVTEQIGLLPPKEDHVVAEIARLHGEEVGRWVEKTMAMMPMEFAAPLFAAASPSVCREVLFVCKSKDES